MNIYWLVLLDVSILILFIYLKNELKSATLDDDTYMIVKIVGIMILMILLLIGSLCIVLTNNYTY